MTNESRAEVTRILNLLRTAMRLLGLSNREVERRMGLSPSYLSRLFGGTIELKMEHVLAIAKAIGLHPAEFFHLAYPHRPEVPTEAAVALRSVLEELKPSAPAPSADPAAPDPSSRDLEVRIQESLRHVFLELAKPKS